MSGFKVQSVYIPYTGEKAPKETNQTQNNAVRVTALSNGL